MADDGTISEEEFATWMRAPEAVRLRSHLDFDERAAQIANWLNLGLLRAAAQYTVIDDKSINFRLIEKSIWAYTKAKSSDSSLWSIGEIVAHVDNLHTGDVQTASLLDVRFDPTGLEKFIPQFGLLQTISLRNEISSIGIPNATLEIIRETYLREGIIPASGKSASSPATDPIPVRRGRPPKEWWDDLWVEMCRQIYVGDLQPKTQADIERAMLDWAAAHEHEMGEATAKRVARKLFPVFGDEGSK